MNSPPTSPKALHYSEIRSFKQCPQQHHYRYTKGLMPAQSDAARLGTLLHNACYWHDVTLGQSLGTYLGEQDFKVLGQPYDWPQSEAKIWDLFSQADVEDDTIRQAKLLYGTWLRVDQAERSPLYNEHIISDGTWEGTFDSLYIDSFGYHVLRDYKTSRYIPPNSFRLMADGQAALYAHMVENALGIKIDYVEWVYMSTQPQRWLTKNKDGSISRRASITTTEALTEQFAPEDIPTEAYDYINDDKWVQVRKFPLSRTYLSKFLDEYSHVRSIILSDPRPYRVSASHCDYCAWQPLCEAELLGRDTSEILTRYDTDE